METTQASFITMMIDRLQSLEETIDRLSREKNEFKERMEMAESNIRILNRYVVKPEGDVFHQNNKGKGSHYRVFLDTMSEDVALSEENDFYYLQRLALTVRDFPEITIDDIEVFGTPTFKCIVIRTESILPYAYISNFVRTSIDIDTLQLSMHVKLFH